MTKTKIESVKKTIYINLPDWILQPFSSARVETNAAQIVRFVDPNNAGGDLRRCFLHSINQLQKFRFQYLEESMVCFSNCSQPYEKLTLQHVMSRQLPLDYVYADNEHEHLASATQTGLDLLHEVDESLYSAFTTIIGCILFGKCPTLAGGSVSDIIGVIWLNPRRDWRTIDFAENLLHEYVHHCLFLEEMVWTIFSETVPRMHEDDALVTSSILKIKRGYDRSYHSAFVAYAIAHFYLAIDERSKARELLSGALETALELRQKQQFLTEHGRKMLTELITGCMGGAKC